MKKFCTFYIVRHGETDWNVKGIIQGQVDVPLNKMGESQAKLLGEKLKGMNFSIVYCSDLKRAKRTAEIIVENRGLPVQTVKDLRERYYGKYEGKHFSLLDKNEINNVKDAKGEVEPIRSLVNRTIFFLNEKAVEHLGQNVLLVTHGGVMRHLLIHLGYGTKESLRAGSVGNTAYVKVFCDGKNITIEEAFGVLRLEDRAGK